MHCAPAKGLTDEFGLIDKNKRFQIISVSRYNFFGEVCMLSRAVVLGTTKKKARVKEGPIGICA